MDRSDEVPDLLDEVGDPRRNRKGLVTQVDVAEVVVQDICGTTLLEVPSESFGPRFRGLGALSFFFVVIRVS